VSPSRSPSQRHLILLHGEANFLVEESAREVLQAWQPGLVSDFGLDVIDPTAINVGRLRDAVLQAPFLDPYRVVAVRGIAPRRADTLATALSQLPSTTHLLLTVNGRLASTSSLVKAVESAGGEVRDHKPPKGRGLQEWVAKRAQGYGLPPMAGALVGRLVRPDLGVWDSELQKLAAYASANRLDQAAIKQLVVGDRPEEIFRLTDHLLPHPDGEAWRAMAKLLETEPPTSIAYRLARHLSLVLAVQAHHERGENLGAIQEAMSEHPFVIQKAHKSAVQMSRAQLESGLRILLDYEWKVKSGQIDAELGLQGVLASL
jgi:DNA polymerase III subunit delta